MHGETTHALVDLLRKVQDFLRQYGFLLLIPTLAFAVGGYVYSSSLPDRYSASVTLEPVDWKGYHSGDSDGREIESLVAALGTRGFSDSSIPERYRHYISLVIVYRSDIARDVRSRIPVGIEIVASGTDREVIKDALQIWSAAAISLSHDWPATSKALPLRNVTPSPLPVLIYPNRRTHVPIFASVGLLMGLALVVLVRGELRAPES